ncbi:MAG: EscU/YscU/HrcU family type III secretion system export apparatus switch protein [Lachnospiraceae bacterium]|nr:EscU/YscU/HrcU family type III secretion system export apparatus switch protein [Lachnospiraceae bacterium]
MADRDKDKDKKKIKTAVALEYDPDDVAPKIIATGKGAIAERIIEKAKEADVPLHEDSKLANTLSKLEIGDYIPPELYEVVAEILVFVDEMEKIRGKIDRNRNQ